MTKMKIIDLYNVRYEDMEEKVNTELESLQDTGASVIDVKVIGAKLNQCAVFVSYQLD